MKVAYQGVVGAFSEVALIEFFKGQDYEAVSYSDFISMLKDVACGKIDYGMFPVENTTTGIIARTYDHFQHYDIHVLGEISVPVDQDLIVLPGTRMEEIRDVFSHPEAISQCQNFFRRHPEIKPVVYEDTALSVRYIRDCNDSGKAAIASSLAAEYYGMEVLKEKIQDNQANMTRFMCISARNEEIKDADKVSIMLVLKHEPGALYNALGLFASKRINVLKLESRPIQGKIFEYCFYLDFQGNLHDPDVVEVLRRLEYDSIALKVFGNYKADQTISG